MTNELYFYADTANAFVQEAMDDCIKRGEYLKARKLSYVVNLLKEVAKQSLQPNTHLTFDDMQNVPHLIKKLNYTGPGYLNEPMDEEFKLFTQYMTKLT